MKKILTVKLTALLSAILLGAPIASAGDSKVLSGLSCQPRNPAQLSDYSFQANGGIKNNLSDARLRVVCPMIKDHNSTLDVANELIDIEIYLQFPATALSPMVCTVVVRRALSGAVFASSLQQIANPAGVGNTVLDYPSLDAPFVPGAFDNRSTYTIQCTVSERSTIRGYFWSEEDDTDVNDEIA